MRLPVNWIICVHKLAEDGKGQVVDEKEMCSSIDDRNIVINDISLWESE